MPVRSLTTRPHAGSYTGFTLIEMVVVVLLLAVAMLGLLSVFDASARINKSESDIADAQGAVRYGIYSMARAIRMAGSGGLYPTQAVLNARDPQLPGITVTNSVLPNSYDNVETGTAVTASDGTTTTTVPVRPGTDMIEIRGVINSPLVAFDLKTGCEPCNVATPAGGCTPCNTATSVLKVDTKTLQQHLNDDPLRPQFSQIDAYTAGASDALPMLVMVAFNNEIHGINCAVAAVYPIYPQSSYNVGKIKVPTSLAGSGTMGPVDFLDAKAREFNAETPAELGINNPPHPVLKNVRHAGILDDMIFFIDNTNPLHPALAQGTRRGDNFDVVTLADDVEDMQIAYGVDTDGNGAINRIVPAVVGTDSDTNVSSQPKGDEWVPNVSGDDNPLAGRSGAFLATDFFDQPNHCPRLHAVMISLVAKSHDPDPSYKSPSALGLLTMNSPATIAPPYPDTAQYPAGQTTTYKRRVQVLKINLRNYAYEGG